MNRSYTHIKSHKKSKASGYRRLQKTSNGQRILQRRRRKKRRIL